MAAAASVASGQGVVPGPTGLPPTLPPPHLLAGPPVTGPPVVQPPTPPPLEVRSGSPGVATPLVVGGPPPGGSGPLGPPVPPGPPAGLLAPPGLPGTPVTSPNVPPPPPPQPQPTAQQGHSKLIFLNPLQRFEIFFNKMVGKTFSDTRTMKYSESTEIVGC